MLLQIVTFGLIASLLVSAVGVLAPLRSLGVRSRICPKCANSNRLTRTPRKPFDRAVGLLVAVRRYRCLSCQWSGLLREAAVKTADPNGSRTDIEIPVFDPQEIKTTVS
ncbi:hypothetical protein [Singulisphaera sp. PoT]|uniref:hypothetical protein n=1 Tax=Singulisphaera sp. PoT TaxID=3411797 RepID=UPI003BF55FC2